MKSREVIRHISVGGATLLVLPLEFIPVRRKTMVEATGMVRGTILSKLILLRHQVLLWPTRAVLSL